MTDEKAVLFSGIVVDMRDAKNNLSIAFCDIAIEPVSIQDINKIKNNPGARELIYGILRRNKVEKLRTASSRNDLKMELKNELNSLFGGDTVKNIYFSQVEIM